jgi:hypothetical protein
MQQMTHRLTNELRKIQRDSHDTCSSCGKPFSDGDTAHSGYNADGLPIYVGNCCVEQVRETAVRYRWTARAYEVPQPETALWRYMDLAKFLVLLRDQGLYFARLDHLGDRWEGAKGDRSNKALWDDHYLRFFQDAIRNPPGGYTCDKTDDEVRDEARRLLQQLEAGSDREQRTTYVSCWHENEAESEALWRLYCPPNTAGVAVKTTAGSLKTVFDNDFAVQIGRVKYIDFRSQFAGVNDSVFRKRKSLQHEQEVRAVIRVDAEEDRIGVTRKVDLQSIVKEVVVSPFTPPWFTSIVEDLLQRFAISLPVRTSELLSDPFF